jgi:hypothetical protein
MEAPSPSPEFGRVLQGVRLLLTSRTSSQQLKCHWCFEIKASELKNWPPERSRYLQLFPHVFSSRSHSWNEALFAAHPKDLGWSRPRASAHVILWDCAKCILASSKLPKHWANVEPPLHSLMLRQTSQEALLFGWPSKWELESWGELGGGLATSSISKYCSSSLGSSGCSDIRCA